MTTTLLDRTTGTDDPPTPTVTPASTRALYPLGWLRGLAALVVVTFHAYQHDRDPTTGAWPLSGWAHQLMFGSDLFVDMFFVLSGLVLWLPVASALAARGPAGSGRMMLYRRLARLLPLYVLIVTVVWAISNPGLPGHWQDLVMHLTFTHVYSDQYIFWTDGPAWSLGVEMHYYVLMAIAMPVVFALGRRARTRRGRLLIAATLPALCITATLAFLVWSTLLTTQDPTNWSLWYGPLSRGADFGVGMLLATTAAAGVRLGRATRGTLALAGVLTTSALVMTRPLDDAGGANEWWHLLYSLSITVGLASIVLHDGPWPRVLSWRPLAWIGGLGYGIYLLHEPVMRFLDHLGLLPAGAPGLGFLISTVIVAVPATALAWVSAHTIEAAGLRLLSLWSRDGSARDYYAHVGEAARSQAARQRGSTSAATRSSTSTDPA